MHAKRCDATATPKTHTAARTVVAGGHAGPVWHVAFAGPSMVFGAPLHALVVFRDGVTAVVDGRTTVWQREEALAHIRHVEFVDLPKKSVLLEGGDVEERKRVAQPKKKKKTRRGPDGGCCAGRTAVLMEYERTNIVTGFVFRATHHWKLLKVGQAGVQPRPAHAVDTNADASTSPHVGTRPVPARVGTWRPAGHYAGRRRPRS